MAIEFEIEDVRVDHDTHVVAVTGEIDLFTAPELKQHVLAAIGEGVATLVVDLSETTFIDSSSLGVLISAHRRLRARGGTLTVVCTQDAIVKTFRITGLDGVFRIVSSLDEALENGHVASGS
jgi:anti-sigma B factor antagonist